MLRGPMICWGVWVMGWSSEAAPGRGRAGRCHREACYGRTKKRFDSQITVFFLRKKVYIDHWKSMTQIEPQSEKHDGTVQLTGRLLFGEAVKHWYVQSSFHDSRLRSPLMFRFEVRTLYLKVRELVLEFRKLEMPASHNQSIILSSKFVQ